ncbi:hypothetical protein [Capnocytophaga sp. oral taxon 338]|uniref:hypothetical protein n=1 Tax=Capnocytophaga sp. oral taxon 338 TaxID=710239 RepID=UPI000202D1B8|nr:hypothetical protein [Capnocytophaga sp. oral taxon 338]EGD33323.1 hypothetical protein HMPREF9071_2117 [Capnocytophaga sp. oral taxon 338 str. F0234]
MTTDVLTPKIKSKNNKQLKRSFRIMRAYLLIKMAHLYSLRCLNQSLMKAKNDYHTAENISNMINEVFGGQTSPQDFICDKNEQADKCINLTEEMKSYEGVLNTLKINPQGVYAFCADVEYNNSVPLFSRYGQIAMYVIGHIMNYDLGMITKDEALKNIQYLKDFEFAPKNLSMVTRKIVIQVEEAFGLVSLRRIIRRYKKEYKGKKFKVTIKSNVPL